MTITELWKKYIASKVDEWAKEILEEKGNFSFSMEIKTEEKEKNEKQL